MGNSIQLNGSNQYLSITGKTGINQRKFTISLWFKRSDFGNTEVIIDFGTSSGVNEVRLSFVSDGTLQLIGFTSSSIVLNKKTSMTFSDTASWHHLLIGVDTTQPTANNRARIYVDGSEIVTWTTNINPLQNSNLENNFASTYNIGKEITSTPDFLNAKLAEFYYIDGQQLDPTYFTAGSNAKVYSGSYNGIFDFYLNFYNSISLGADSSGEGNNWTPQNSPSQSADVPPGTPIIGYIADPGTTIIPWSGKFYTRKYIEGELAKILDELDEPRRIEEDNRRQILRNAIVNAKLSKSERLSKQIIDLHAARDRALAAKAELLG